jgi:hypothetical protein
MEIGGELERLGKYIVSQIRREMTMKKKNASKSLYKSLRYDIQQSKDSFAVIIKSDKIYSESILTEKGFKKSKKNPSDSMVDNIEAWMKARGIKGWKKSQRQSAYLIAKSVLRKGYKGSEILKTAFTRAEKRIKKDTEGVFKKYLEHQLKGIIKDINE